MTSTWTEGVRRSLEGALGLLAEAVRDCPDDRWESPMWPVPAPEPSSFLLGPGGVPVATPDARETLAQRRSMPWGVAWHALEVLDYDFAGEFGPWSPPAPFAGHPHWRDLTVLANPWSRGDILGYIEYCKRSVEATLGGMTEDLAAKPLPAAHRYAGQPHAWVIASLVGHTAEHAAQIGLFVAEREQPRSGVPRA